MDGSAFSRDCVTRGEQHAPLTKTRMGGREKRGTRGLLHIFPNEKPVGVRRSRPLDRKTAIEEQENQWGYFYASSRMCTLEQATDFSRHLQIGVDQTFG